MICLLIVKIIFIELAVQAVLVEKVLLSISSRKKMSQLCMNWNIIIRRK